ncbi:MAG: DUF3015 family protein [Deltaproteobacteria bacterium]|nr:DUF3015 family protein [Deltaproteobacteria bacterium]
MRNIFVTVALGALAVSSLCLAAEKKQPLYDQFGVGGQGYGTAGCGLGSVVFGDKPGMVQVVAATTNNIGSSQTFGITSGTSNCVEQQSMAQGFKEKLNYFVQGNRHRLENDIAKASGDTVTALAELGRCSGGNLGAVLQPQYGKIFSSDNQQDVVDNLYGAISNSKLCNI